MFKFLKLYCLFVLIVFSQVACAISWPLWPGPELAPPLPGYGTLDKLPFRECWYATYFEEDKVGASHFKIEPSGSNFKITTNSLIKLKTPEKTDKIAQKDEVIVRPDLTLVSFTSLVNQNDKELQVVGIDKGGRFVVDMTTRGDTMNKEYPIDGELYHSSAISLMPAMKGLDEGKTYSFKVLNLSTLAVETVKQEVTRIRDESAPKESVWKVKNTYGVAVVNFLVNREGLVVSEKEVGSPLRSTQEDPATARAFLEKN